MYLSREFTSEAIAFGEEQSMRILPSVSSVMKRQVGSTSGLTTSIGRPCSARYCQYCTAAPPMGSAPCVRPADLMAGKFSAYASSSQ